jgi:hypothetical protein
MWIADPKVVDALRIEMYFAAVVVGKSLEQFGNSTLRAVLPVDERRNNSEPQVSASNGAPVALRGHWPRTAPRVLW